MVNLTNSRIKPLSLASREAVEGDIGRLHPWPNILWREWRNSEDEEYAEHLFDLVAETPIGGQSIAVLALCSALYGLLAGYWLGFIALNWNLPAHSWIYINTLPLTLAWLMGIAGGLTGALAGRWLSWRVWLGLLSPHVFGNKLGGLGQSAVELLAGFILGMLGLPVFWGLVTGGLLGLNRLGLSGKWKLMGSIFAGGLGVLIGSLIPQGHWLGLGVGLIFGAWLGLTVGSLPLGILISWLGLLLSLLFLGVASWLAGWLAVVTGFGLGLLPNLVGHGIDAAAAYRYRTWYFWWQDSPTRTGVERALQLTQATLKGAAIWAEPLRRLAQQQDQPGHPILLMPALESQDWVDRFAARHALIAMGGEAIPALQKIAADSTHSLQATALWLLTGIERETTNRLAQHVTSLFCPRCLAHFGRRSVDLSWGISFTYYGCRHCGQSRNFVQYPKGIRAVLDSGWREAVRPYEKYLQVNWLSHRRLFDFNRVDIIQATDEEVERFALQVGNDTDPLRRHRYLRMRCVIASTCHLSENTLRILRRLFGRVEYKEIAPGQRQEQ